MATLCPVSKSVVFPAACLLSGEGMEAVGFVFRHPEVSLNLAAFSLSSAVGQVRSYIMVHLEFVYISPF